MLKLINKKLTSSAPLIGNSLLPFSNHSLSSKAKGLLSGFTLEYSQVRPSSSWDTLKQKTIIFWIKFTVSPASSRTPPTIKNSIKTHQKWLKYNFVKRFKGWSLNCILGSKYSSLWVRPFHLPLHLTTQWSLRKIE